VNLQAIVAKDETYLPGERADHVAKVGMVCMLAASKMAVEWTAKVQRTLQGPRVLRDIVNDITT
jgi:hypothetical protein